MSEHRNGTADGQPRTEADAEKALTGRPLTLDYRPNWVAALSMTEDSGRWPYAVMLRDIERMLGHPDVQLPYDHYRDGISSVKFAVKCRNDREEQFAFQQLKRLWEHDLDRAMLSYDYGWAGLEVVYREKGALLHYDGLEPVHPLDAWARVRGGKYAGFQVRGNLRLGAQTSSRRRGGDEQCMDLWGPGRWPAKGLWIVHNRRWDRFYGRSQLFGAWRPWQRLANRDGAEEVTDGGFYRFAYKGPVIRYPASDFKRKGGSLNDVDYDAARNAAREMAEQAKAGFSVALPNSRDEKGNYKWEMEWPDSTMNVEPLLGYVDHLQKAIARGIGVPPELLEASEVGSGWSGRMIPLIVFQTTMRKNARNIVRAFVRQVVEPLLVWNFGPGAFCEADAEIVMPPGLAPEQPGQGQPGAAPPDAAAAPAPDAGGAGGGGGDALAQMLGGGAGGGGAGGGTPYQGPRGGKGWKDASGKVHYGELSTVPDGFDLSTAVECDGWELATINSADWQPYTGKRGKRAGMAGWKSTVTGRVSWGPHRPGTYSYHKQRTERAMASRAAPKGQRSTPDEAHHAVRALLGEGATPTPEKISEAVEVLLALPMADLKALKARVGAVGGGGKSGLAARIAARAGLVAPPPLPEKAKAKETAPEANKDTGAGTRKMTVTSAFAELDRLRNALSWGDDPADLLRQVDEIGAWAAKQKSSDSVRKVLEEAHSLADKLQGGSGKGGNRVRVTEPGAEADTPPVPEKAKEEAPTRWSALVKVPTGEDIGKAEFRLLGNKWGNREHVVVTVGGKDWVVKQVQDPAGADRERAGADLSNEVGIPSPRGTGAIDIPDYEKKAHAAGTSVSPGDPTMAIERVEGRTPTKADAEAVRSQAGKALLFRFLTGNDDANPENFLLDGQGQLWQIDHEPAFRPGALVALGAGGTIPDGSPGDATAIEDAFFYGTNDTTADRPYLKPDDIPISGRDLDRLLTMQPKVEALVRQHADPYFVTPEENVARIRQRFQMVASLRGKGDLTLGDLVKTSAPEANKDTGADTPPALPEPNFTGTLTDALGREYHFVDGKRVAGPPEAEDGLESAGTGGDARRVRRKQRLGAVPGEAPESELPGAGGGAGADERPEAVPDRADGGGDGAGGPAGGAGSAAARGQGAGDGGAAASPGGSAGDVGDGGGAAARPGGGNAAVERALAGPATPEKPTDLSAGNWRYPDTGDERTFARGGLKQKFADNLAAIKTIRAIAAEGRSTATPEEQAVISKFVGWGQFPALFNNYWDRDWMQERTALQAILSPEEWDAARKSTLNAHYTHPDVVKAHWEMAKRLGFDGGRFLETSAGIGYYLGMMPPDMAARTHASAVELDPTTGKMLSLLYPAANVAVQGFQDFQAPDNFYDLIASNVPFGDYRVHDPRYNKHQANIHDYFFLKSADKVRPGGLVMHVTSTGTMDKADPKMRALLAEKGLELVSAIRFPAGAHKENAGTDVVTDMLVFRKKHAHEGAEDLAVTPDEAEPEKAGFTGMTTDSLGRVYHWKDGKRVPGPRWDDVVMVPDPAGGEPIPVNRYFADNPEQVLGTLDRTGTMYQGKSVNVSRTDDYAERLKAAIGRIPEGVLRKAAAPAERFAPSVQPAPGDVKEGGYTSRDGKLLVRDGGALVEVEASAADRKRILAHLEVRDALRAVINAQLAGEDATAARKKLNEVYDAFVKAHGALNLPANKKAFRADPDSPVLLALEKYDPKTKKATKADIFARDTIRPATKAEKAATAHEALGISLHETGRVDIDRMAELLGRDPETVGRALVAGGVAYEDPSSGWAPADQYLSGNVRRKLLLAQAAAQADPKYLPNVEALKAVQPEDIDHADIDVKLGASWVPPSDVAAFAAHILQGRPEALRIDYSAAAGQWFASFDRRHGRWLENSQQATEVWSIDKKRANFLDIFQAALNGTSITVWDPPASKDEKATVNRQKTDDANAKVEEMKEAFKGWVWEDDARRERLHRFYNDNFNNVRNLRYDGSHQTFPGMNAGITLRPHQRDFVWQVVTTGKGLAAHEVGTGKTLSMIAAAMELRRLGLAKKPAIACLKANIEQITASAQDAYPGARIISTADMFDAASRKATIARIATGDYDLVLLTHDHLDMLPMKPEVSARYIREELAELEAAIVASREADGSKNNRVVKALEKSKLKLEARLKASLSATGTDDAVTFEETGIDHLFVDEAHKYKSLPVYTRRQGLKGVPTQTSDRATAMEMRTRWLMENNGGRGVVFATGTPVANTMAELYTMQKYLQRDELKERGVDTFDAWANAFGDIQTKMEFTVSGEYKPVSRFAKFVNIPELMQMTRQMMDVQRADGMTKEDGSPVIVRPKRKDDVIVAPKSDPMSRLMDDLQRRARALKGQRPGEKGSDNMLSICNDGRKGALDMRLLDAAAEDDPESKVNQAIRKILELHRASPDRTQLIFSDAGVNPTDQGFHLYGDVIQKLVDGGIPREKIADFSQLDGAKKEAAMEAMRKGEILIGIGSTDKLGTGVNVQNKVMALHHLDTPRDYTPAGVEQRDGRGWRQGNENKEVGIYRYVTEGSLDQTMWQIIGNKMRFIRQVMTNSGQVERVARDEDAEELSPEQLMAAASGDPRVLEKVNLDEDVKQLTAAQRRHDREQQKFRDTVAASERNLPHFERAAKAVRADVDVLAANPDFSLSIRGQKYTDRKEADEAFLQWQKDHADEVARSGSFPSKLGTFRGLDLWLSKGSFALKGPGGELHPTGDSLRSIEAIARNLAKRADDADTAHAEAKAGVEAVRANLGKVFAKAQELADKQARLKELEAALAGKEDARPDPATGPAGAREKPKPTGPAAAVDDLHRLAEDGAQMVYGRNEYNDTTVTPVMPQEEFERRLEAISTLKKKDLVALAVKLGGYEGNVQMTNFHERMNADDLARRLRRTIMDRRGSIMRAYA